MRREGEKKFPEDDVVTVLWRYPDLNNRTNYKTYKYWYILNTWPTD